MSKYECDICGLCGSDLPDGVDPELCFESARGKTWCVVHIDSDVAALFEETSTNDD